MVWTTKRRWLLWFGGMTLWLTLIIQPENRGILRLAALALFLSVYAGGIALAWPKRPLRISLIALAIVLVVPFLLPGRNPDAARLREAYTQSLAAYEGTTYSWGGENRFGIDCSGLVRRGFISACVKEGLRTANGSLLRQACDLWWHDASAKAMGEEYRGETVLLLDTPSINQLDHARLLPGDIAVTENGVHTLVYIGDNRWMQADPGRGRASYEHVPVKDSGWFSTPVHILRWKLLHLSE